MKKLLAILVGLSLIASFSSCSSVMLPHSTQQVEKQDGTRPPDRCPTC